MKVYITFGQVHIHSINGITFDKDSVAVIEAESECEGRKIACEIFNNKYFTSYINPKHVHIEYFPRGFISIYPENPVCPECASYDIGEGHHYPTALAPECTYMECNDCNNQWGHE